MENSIDRKIKDSKNSTTSYLFCIYVRIQKQIQDFLTKFPLYNRVLTSDWKNIKITLLTSCHRWWNMFRCGKSVISSEIRWLRITEPLWRRNYGINMNKKNAFGFFRVIKTIFSLLWKNVDIANKKQFLVKRSSRIVNALYNSHRLQSGQFHKKMKTFLAFLVLISWEFLVAMTCFFLCKFGLHYISSVKSVAIKRKNLQASTNRCHSLILQKG